MARPLSTAIIRTTSRRAGPLIGTDVRRSFTTFVDRVTRLQQRHQVERTRNPLRDMVPRQRANSVPTREDLRRAASDRTMLSRLTQFLSTNPTGQNRLMTFTQQTSILPNAGHDYAVVVAPDVVNEDAAAWIEAHLPQLPLLHAQSMFPESGYRTPARLAQRTRVLSDADLSYRQWYDDSQPTADDATQAAARLQSDPPLEDGDAIALGNDTVTAHAPTITETDHGVVVSAAMETVNGNHALHRGQLLWTFTFNRDARTLQSAFIGSGRSPLPFVDLANVEVGGPLMATAQSLLTVALNQPELRARILTEGHTRDFYNDVLAAAPDDVAAAARRLECMQQFSYVAQVLQQLVPAVEPTDVDRAAVDRLADAPRTERPRLVDGADEASARPGGSLGDGLPRIVELPSDQPSDAPPTDPDAPAPRDPQPTDPTDPTEPTDPVIDPTIDNGSADRPIDSPTEQPADPGHPDVPSGGGHGGRDPGHDEDPHPEERR